MVYALRALRRWQHALFGTFAFALGVQGQNDICSLEGQSVSIVGERLFFAAGTYTYDGGNANAFESNLFYINLTSSFPAHSYIAQNTYNTVPLPSGAPDDDSGAYSHMFYSNTSVYLYYPDTSNPNTLYVYNVSTGSFTQNNAQDGIPDSFMTQYTGSYQLQDTSIPATGVAYYVGTASSDLPGKAKRNEEVPRLSERDEGTGSWMQSLNLAPGNLVWTYSQGTPPLLDGAVLQYIRAGDNGTLIAFGGSDPASHTEFAQSNMNDIRDMSEIFVYDIASSTWYNVSATGDIPNGRINFCAGVSTAPDDSSFQITMYGGWDQFDETVFNDVYVLSIPAFQWIDVTPKNQTGGDGETFGRTSARCQVWQDSQMLILGGSTYPLNNPNRTLGCDASHAPLLVLNTATYEWADTFTPDLNYTQPSQVYKAIGGDASGKGPSQPSGGFDDPALTSIFSQRVPFTPMPALQPPPQAQQNGSAPSLSPSSVPTDPPSSSHAGAIAGGVVGGIVGLALIVGAIFFFLRRRRYTALSRSPHELDSRQKPMDYAAGEIQEAGGEPVRAEADAMDPKQHIREMAGDEDFYGAKRQSRPYELP